jgi:4-oxalomesaconate tautomerase
VVVVRAADLGRTGYETPAELAADAELNERVQSLRVQAGKLMGLGDVTATSVPKTTLVAAPRAGGAISTRTFIPVQPHPAIGVLGAVSVLTAVLIDGAVGHELLVRPDTGPFQVEHPSGALQVDVELGPGDPPTVRRSTVIRTARPLFDGIAFPRP